MEGYSKHQFDDILFNDITRKRKHFVHNHLTFVVCFSSSSVIAALVLTVFNERKSYRNFQLRMYKRYIYIYIYKT